MLENLVTEGWEECGYAGHCMMNGPVFFVRRLKVEIGKKSNNSGFAT
jgi:hypothetical protein